MQDKDFLGYFTQLGGGSPAQLTLASNNIVNTLIASSTAKHPEKESEELATLMKKYLQGDLGENMPADLNYTLKRMVRGLSSDNHAAKQGYFLGSC